MYLNTLIHRCGQKTTDSAHIYEVNQWKAQDSKLRPPSVIANEHRRSLKNTRKEGYALRKEKTERQRNEQTN